MSGEKIKLPAPVIVEGKYDKIKLESIADGIVITTDGFGIYKDREKLSLIRRYAEAAGIIILTDSDGAGFQIRNHLKGCIKNGKITNIYIPDIFGKEKRKEKPSKEGKLGVEGMDKEVLIKAFSDAGLLSPENEKKPWINKARLISDGLSGGENSSEKRKALCLSLGLPERISSKGLLDALNTLFGENNYLSALERINNDNKQ